jgi:hypothetical protein
LNEQLVNPSDVNVSINGLLQQLLGAIH